MSVKAAVMPEPGRVEVQEFPKPEIDDHSMLLRIDRVGVCGGDRHLYLGHSALPFPIIAGHELVGTIVKRGKAIEEKMKIVGGEVREGDQVTVVPSSQPCG